MVAIEALAERRGVDTDAAGITLVPMGGAQAIGRFLDLFVPQGLKLAGLCDAAEESDVRTRARARRARLEPDTRQGWSSSGSTSASKTWRTS